MGKRSNLPRRDRDAYPTPPSAVWPLIPWLAGVRTFAEPCAGDDDDHHDLVRHLESRGLRCVYQGDIATGQDALALDHYDDADAIITNPPWKRPILHLLLQHFARIAPTWLLIDQDWGGTKQATPYLASCTDILPIGRQIWIPGTDMPGKDNAAWFRFDARHVAGPIFHPFRSAPVSSRATLCGQCGKPYRPQRSSSKFCSDTCRQRAHRSRLSVTERDTERSAEAAK
jgi:hypothetical protein